jgi:nucleotide-binding universal stress UspA family protein
LAIEMAVAFQAELLLLGVAPTFATLNAERSGAAHMLPATTAALLDLEREQLRGDLLRLAETALGQDVRCAIELESGDAASALLAAIEQQRPDLVVFASHGKKGLDLFLTESVGARLCSHSPSPLLVQPIG